jgi:hypothetical protein
MPRSPSAEELLTQVELAVLAGRNLTQVEDEVLASAGVGRGTAGGCGRSRADTAPVAKPVRRMNERSPRVRRA